MNCVLCRTALALSTFALAAVSLLAIPAAAAEKCTSVTPFNGKNLDGWKARGPIHQSKWTVGIAKVDPDNPRRLVVEPAGDRPGELVTAEGHGHDLYTEGKFGDCTIEVEVMVPKGSNSGIYVMGEYEIQVLDSFGKTQVGPGDMGGLYGAKPPSVNASKQPGTWQKFVIDFTAPRFADGKKVTNARFNKITLNGKVIHEGVELPKQTPGGVMGREVPEGPLMFQGNHGGVAYRNIKITIPAKK